MSKNDSNGTAQQRMTDALSDYEDALREFSTNAVEFLKQVPLLTKAREAYERATTASTQIREILDRGDETLDRFMAQMQQTVSFPLATDSVGDAKPEAETVPANKGDVEKANAARV